MITKTINLINFLFSGLGFVNLSDFTNSLFHHNFTKPIFSLVFSLGAIATIIEQFLGITPLAYLMFMILVCAEFYTGIHASLKNGRKIQSRKLSRMILKMGVYTFLIGLLFIFSEELKIPQIFGMEINVYKFIYYSVLNLIIIQLIISVLENLSDMGYSETNLLLKVIKKKLEKYLQFTIEDK